MKRSTILLKDSTVTADSQDNESRATLPEFGISGRSDSGYSRFARILSVREKPLQAIGRAAGVIVGFVYLCALAYPSVAQPIKL